MLKKPYNLIGQDWTRGKTDHIQPKVVDSDAIFP